MCTLISVVKCNILAFPKCRICSICEAFVILGCFSLNTSYKNIQVNLPVACPFLQIKFCWELQSLSLNDPVVLRAPQFSIPATLSGSLAHWLKKKNIGLT